MFDEKAVKRISALFLVLVLIILSFIVVRPILISVILGLLFAYILYPLYVKVYRVIKEKNISALIICVVIVAIIFLLLWFIVPIMIQQTFDFYTYTQRVDLLSPIKKLFPNVFSSPDFSKEILISMHNFVGKFASFLLEGLTNILLSIPLILLHVVVIFFTLFFALRDNEIIIRSLKGISPLTPEAEKKFFEQSRDITRSFIYGILIIGLVQGIVTGIGLFIFRVPNATMFTVLAVLVGILPMIGPMVIWLPAGLYLLLSGNTASGVGLLVFGAVIVSLVEPVLRPYIISKTTKIHPLIAFIGMIGGVFVFGIIGLIIGPLVLAYLLIVAEFYKEKRFDKLFK
ncbi:AI-2E family transporter [Candidatus Pacearchaeota archaeon]|nr:AI-2E family transporter [Candidatus Pacearchaeota archaeon]